MSNHFGIIQSTFEPRNLGSILTGWWDGNDPSANGTKPANNASVSTWVDKSTYGNNLTQGTGALQFVYKTSLKNGLGGFSVNTAQAMTSANPPSGWTFGTNARSIIFVFNITGTISGNNQVVWGQGGGGNGNNTTFGHLNAGGAVFGIDSGGTGNYVTFNTTTVVQNTYYVWEYYCPSGTLTASTSVINGTSQSATSHSYTGGVVASSAVTAGNPNAVSLNGNYLEVIACNAQLNSTQQTLVRAYLRNKWNI
jgi:hypothetical protein